MIYKYVYVPIPLILDKRSGYIPNTTWCTKGKSIENMMLTFSLKLSHKKKSIDKIKNLLTGDFRMFLMLSWKVPVVNQLRQSTMGQHNHTLGWHDYNTWGHGKHGLRELCLGRCGKEAIWTAFLYCLTEAEKCKTLQKGSLFKWNTKVFDLTLTEGMLY